MTTEIHPLFEGAPKTTEFKKLRKRLLRNTREAIEHYGMIEPGRAGWSAYRAVKTATRSWRCSMS